MLSAGHRTQDKQYFYYFARATTLTDEPRQTTAFSLNGNP